MAGKTVDKLPPAEPGWSPEEPGWSPEEPGWSPEERLRVLVKQHAELENEYDLLQDENMKLERQVAALGQENLRLKDTAAGILAVMMSGRALTVQALERGETGQ